MTKSTDEGASRRFTQRRAFTVDVPNTTTVDQLGHRTDTEGRHMRAVSKVVAHMRAHLSEPMDLDELAHVASVSKFHLVRIFEHVTGTTPHHFLSCLRIQRSKELLRCTSLSVTEVCMEVGYSSLGSFSSIFTELVGFTPRAFRALPDDLDTRQISTAAHHYRLLGSERKSHCVEGTIRATSESCGPIFVGLFPTSVPHCLPAEGTLMLSPGEFHLAAPSVREWYVLAVSVSVDQLAHNVECGAGKRLVARATCYAGPGMRVVTPALQLRPQLDTDPPIVVALRALLGQRSLPADGIGVDQPI
jgi:AraC-like DNA-binding protein